MGNRYLDVVHLTDTHLFAEADGELLGVVTDAALRAVVADVLRRVPAPDLVLVTGDLVHDETLAGYQRLRSILDGLPAPVYALPGNHDDRALLANVFRGSPAGAGAAAVHGQWQVICLDSSVPGRVEGTLDSRQLSWLENELAQRRAPHALVCLHHPPVLIGSRWLDRLGLEQGPELLRVASASARVRGIVWGHVHQVWEKTVESVCLLATPATCVQFLPGAESFALDGESKPGWRWLRLHEDGRIETTVHWIELAGPTVSR